MASLSCRQIPSVLLILLGVGLVVSLLVTFPHAGQQEYYHTVSPIEEADVPDAANVTAFGNLSPPARDAFQAAVESDDGRHVVRGEANAPPEWHYSDHSSINQGYYVITYDGDYYELQTSAGSFEFMFGFVVTLGCLIGLGIAAVGGSALWRDRPRTPATILPIFASIGVLVFIGQLVPASMRDAVLVIGSGVVGVVAGGTWILLGRVWERG